MKFPRRTTLACLTSAALAATAITAAHAAEPATPDWAPDRSDVTVYTGRTVAINLRAPDTPDDVTYRPLNDRGRADEQYGNTIIFRPEGGEEGGKFELYYEACRDSGAECDYGTITITVYQQIPKFALRSITSAAGNTYVIGTVVANNGSTTAEGVDTRGGSPVTVTRSGAQVGRGDVAGSLLVDRVNAATRPGILVSAPSRPGTYTYTLHYPGTSETRPGQASIAVTIK